MSITTSRWTRVGRRLPATRIIASAIQDGKVRHEGCILLVGTAMDEEAVAIG